MEKVILRVVCAWCHKVMQPGVPEAPTSHGICPQCQETQNLQLDALEAQQMTIDHEVKRQSVGWYS